MEVDILNKNNRAFTLIELLVVIAIIAILAAILFPVFAQAKAAAKRTADMSNVKNMTLGFHIYSSDSDETAPPMWQVADWGLPRYQLIVWKDSVLPYIKNGGKYPKPDGSAYTTAERPDGGIFQSPLFTDGAWATNNLPAGSSGDATTRFPRAYAINNSAGIDEGMGSRESDGKCYWYTEKCTFWQKVEPTNGMVQNQGGSGSMTSLQNPANTILLTTTRGPWPNEKAIDLAYECTVNGDGYGGTGMACQRSLGNGQINFGFFDGHSKAVKGKQAVALDMFGLWGQGTALAGGPDDWGGQNWTLKEMAKIKEWN